VSPAGRLAGAVYADHENDERSVALGNDERMFHRRQDFPHRLTQTIFQCIEVLQFLASQSFLQACDDGLCRVNADIGQDELRFQLLENTVVDLAARCQISEIVAKPGIAAVETRAKSLDESTARPAIRCVF
jgi:alpha-D-ribose 1-methylphosphonate 5-triphosphate synthase subunit PhnG